MKTKELIELLKAQDPDKEIMIQQGEDYDYMKAYSVKEMELVDTDSDEDDTISYVVINYQ